MFDVKGIVQCIHLVLTNADKATLDCKTSLIDSILASVLIVTGFFVGVFLILFIVVVFVCGFRSVFGHLRRKLAEQIISLVPKKCSSKPHSFRTNS